MLYIFENKDIDINSENTFYFPIHLNKISLNRVHEWWIWLHSVTNLAASLRNTYSLDFVGTPPRSRKLKFTQLCQSAFVNINQAFGDYKFICNLKLYISHLYIYIYKWLNPKQITDNISVEKI